MNKNNFNKMSKLLIIKSNIQHIITFILHNKIIEKNDPMFQHLKFCTPQLTA